MLLEQAQMEMNASMTYLSMAYFFESLGMPGYQKHFMEQSVEERGHSIEFLDYVSARGGTPKVLATTQPPTDFTDPVHAMTATMDFERSVSDSINEQYGRAMEAKDWPTVSFLHKFVAYQIEEEDESETLAQSFYRLVKKGDMSQLLDRAVTDEQ